MIIETYLLKAFCFSGIVLNSGNLDVNKVDKNMKSYSKEI